MTADPYAPLRALFTDAGYTFVEPPIVHDAAVFVEVAGEDLRRRMLLTSDAEGRELALRPEYTVPVCLHHLATGGATRAASYAYLGPVFRQRSAGAAEFVQAGVESLGRSDAIAADADILALAMAAARELRLAGARITVGDSGLFAAVLAALDLVEPWRRRLRRAFGDPARLKALIAASAVPHDAEIPPANPAELRDRVSEMFSATGLGVIGARTAEEIAERWMEKSTLARGIGARAAEVLGQFLAITAPVESAGPRLRSLAKGARLSLASAIDRFEQRAQAFRDRSVDLGSLTFAADFGRRLDYYTGFVFEFQRGDAGPVIGGGRYDRLMSLIHHPSAPQRDVPAVGFAISLDRVNAE